MAITYPNLVRSTPTVTQISPSSLGSLDLTRVEIWAQSIQWLEV